MLQEKGDAKEGKPPGVVRTLVNGDYFGEVSPMFDCKRSATVMARNFGTYGELDKDSMTNLMNQYPLVKVFMWENIINIYDDDLKLFLSTALGSISYLKDLAVEHPAIITHLGFCMEARL